MHLFFGVAIAALLFPAAAPVGPNGCRGKAQGRLLGGVVLLLGVVCTLLVVTGRLHILGAIFAALVPFTVGGGPSSSGCCGGVFAMGLRRRWWQ